MAYSEKLPVLPRFETESQAIAYAQAMLARMHKDDDDPRWQIIDKALDINADGD